MRDKNKKWAVKLEGVAKSYRLYQDKPTLVEKLIKRSRNEKFYALENVDLVFKQGEKIGIIGPNGSGKTTLLKIIAGITTPNEGKVKTRGKIVSLIDLGAGFHPELTGRENIYLNGLLIGLSKEEIKQKIDEIINFADIGKFIDMPVYTYSTGMKLRLGFSIAIYADPDILILDEGISAGDKDFQEKMWRKVEVLFKKNKTIIMVTHWLEFLKDYLEKTVLFHEGKVIMFDKTEKVLDVYLKKYLK